MWAWLKRLFGSNENLEELSVYKPKERLIYRYFNGKEEIAVDPMVVYKAIMAIAADLDIDMRLAASMHSDSWKGYDNSVKKLRSVFNLKPLDEGGLEEDLVFDLFEHFMAYNERIKKNLKNSQTSTKETSAHSNRLSVASPNTLNSLDSGSIEGESSTKGLAPLPMP